MQEKLIEKEEKRDEVAVAAPPQKTDDASITKIILLVNLAALVYTVL